MRIHGNIQALNTFRNLQARNNRLSQTIERLSAGLRINRAADAAAGLAMATKMQTQILSLNQARRNIQDGISLSQTASGALNSVNNILARMRELANQAANDALTTDDRREIQREFNAIRKELDSIAKNTTFNGMSLLDGSSSLMAGSDSALLSVVAQGGNLALLEEVAGSYRLEIETTAGRSQVKNSHIMSLINGTRAEEVITTPQENAVTGLERFRAQGLAKGEYRVQTRAQPFGGIFYVARSGAETTNLTNDLGVNQVQTSPIPHIMPFGEYSIETAEEVPFMATFADFLDPVAAGYTDDIIRGVGTSNRNYIDVSMDIRAEQSAADASTEVAWKDINGEGGGIILINPGGVQVAPTATEMSVNTIADHNVNIYTHFRVTDREDRFTLANEIQAQTYYRSVANSAINMNLTYTAEASTAQIMATYRTNEAGTVNVTASYQSEVGEEVIVETTYIFAGGSIVNIDGTEVDISGRDIEGARADLEAEFAGLEFTTADNGAGERRIVVENNTGETINISGAGAVALGLDGNLVAGAIDNGEYLDYEKEHNFAVGGMDITEIAAAIDFNAAYELDVSAIDTSDGRQHLQIDNNGQHRLSFSNQPDSVQTELGINDIIIDPQGIHNGEHVFHGHTFSVGYGQGQSITDLTAALENGVTAENVSGTSINDFTAQTVGATVQEIEFDNNSRYQLILEGTGSGAAELGFDGSHTLNRGVSWQDGLKVYHQHSINIAFGNGYAIDDVASTIEDAVRDENVDGVTIEDFQISAEPEGGDLHRFHFINQSSYQLVLTDETGATAQELNIDDLNLNRSENDFTTAHRVYDNHVVEVAVGNVRLNTIGENLQNALVGTLSGDDLNHDGDSVFSAFLAAGDGRIAIANANTLYRITLTDHLGATADELGIDATIDRDGSHNGTARAYDRDLGSPLTPSYNIEELYDQVNDLAGWIEVGWEAEPGYDGNSHHGQFQISNAHDNADRFELVFTGDGTAELFDSAEISINHLGNQNEAGIDNTQNTEVWLARDNVTVTTDYSGIDRGGNLVNGISTDVWWRGDVGTTNLLTNLGPIPFSSVYIPDFYENQQQNHELTVGDSWMLFTHAEGGHNHTVVDSSLYDDATSAEYRWGGSYGGGRYVFSENVLNDSTRILPQAVRTGMGTFEVVRHDISFGQVATYDNAVVYSQRFGSGAFDHYAHAYYGDETTYFFQNEGEWQDYFGNIRVWRQENSNATLLFTYEGGGTFGVQGRAYDRDGTFREIDETVNLSSNSSFITIGDIHFDNLEIHTDAMVENDKFVINVAARAGQGVDDDARHSDDHIAITGNPWMDEERGSTMQYRFDEGAVNGQELEILGYYIDPILGAEVDIGVWTGRPVLEIAATGFAGNDTRFGGNQEIQMQINHHGTTEHVAAALITGHYFEDMTEDETYYDFLETITYDEEQTQNAAVIFEVIKGGSNEAVLRAQAHIYDRSGAYRYEFEDYIVLREKNENITFFDHCGEGLTFSEFHFEDLARLQKGDRFSFSMAANAESEDSTHDEVYLWSNAYREDIYPHSWRFENGVLDNTTTTLRTYQVDYQSGTVYDSEIDFTFGAYHGGTATGIIGDLQTPRDVEDTVRFVSEEKRSEDLGTAHRYSRLRDINFFWNQEGRFLLEDPAVVEIHQGNQKAQVVLHGDDELMDVVERINRVIYEDLGQKSLVEEEDQFKFVSFVNSPYPQSNLDVMEGSMVIRSALPGQEGELLVSGREELVKALGLAVIQSTEENSYNINVHNLSTGETVAQGLQVYGNQGVGILPGLTLQLDTILGIDSAEYQRCAETFNQVASQSEEIYVRLADRRRVLQIGANVGQIARFDLGDVSQRGLGIDRESVLTRELANRAMKRLDNAIIQVASQRSNLGALESRLEHTFDYLAVAAENLTQSKSRIQDLDMAKEYMNFTREQIFTQTGNFFLAQANMRSQYVLQLLG